MRLRSELWWTRSLAAVAGCSEPAFVSDYAADGHAPPDGGGEVNEVSPEPQSCAPGQARCHGEQRLEICDASGTRWITTSCPQHSWCSELDGDDAGGTCVSTCEGEIAGVEGCAFVLPALPAISADDGEVVVTNATDEPTRVELRQRAPTTAETTILQSATLAGGASVQWAIPPGPVGSGPTIRAAGRLAVISDRVVGVTQYTLDGDARLGDGARVLPSSALGITYVAVSDAPAADVGAPSYFELAAIVDGTTVEWTPPVATASGDDVPPVAAGHTAAITLHANE